MNSLTEVRENIDQIDQQLVKLLGERREYVLQATAFKKDSTSVKASDRVEEVIQKVRSLALEYQTDPDLIEQIYRELIRIFTAAEQERFEETNDSNH